ncbi:hypothetical protein BESB_025950 [Besnoitia besnoiti]|uniref:EB1 C-terminal domain-containing protein n=1 Tax=Besnoitia besnoiti TaxID=94643 RepID=A0A2A9M5N4_BESBE|nr:uncharacterized protein BESB_025950 [Besnoitia besnoiti]PFH31621.1 hypothetical protein BESB_025950 [Besnoitia besnoiti]
MFFKSRRFDGGRADVSPLAGSNDHYGQVGSFRRPPSLESSAALREQEVVGQTIAELQLLLDLDEQCQQAARELKLQQLVLMRERNAYLKKLREIEGLCEARAWTDEQRNERELELLSLLKEILYSEEAAPF